MKKEYLFLFGENSKINFLKGRCHKGSSESWLSDRDGSLEYREDTCFKTGC